MFMDPERLFSLQLYTCFEDSNYVYLVLEVCHNGELQAYIRQNGPVSEDVARHYMKQIISGLLYLHSHHILHRDLTLANILLTKDMKVKIADFGLATKIEPGEEHTTMCGTPNYISPEVASRGQQILETDVWSLGCMLYTLVVGRPPFDTREVRSTLNRVIAVDYELPSRLSPDVADLISGLLRRLPQDRIKLSAMLKHPFMIKSSANRQKVENSGDSGIDSMTRTPIGFRTSSTSLSDSNRPILPQRPGSTAQVSAGGCDATAKAPIETLRDLQMRRSASMSESFEQRSRPSLAATCLPPLAPFHPSERQRSFESTSGQSALPSFRSDLSPRPIDYSTPSSRASWRPSSSLQKINNLSSNNLSGISTASVSAATATAPANPTCRSSSGPRTSYQISTPVAATPIGRASSASGINTANGACLRRPPAPLDARRLRPMRTFTRMAIINILADESVCLEFFDSEKKSCGEPQQLQQQDRFTSRLVTEVMGISRDGRKIVIYQPNGGKGARPAPEEPMVSGSNTSTTPTGSPVPASPGDTFCVFTLDRLPENYWKKYQFVTKFVNMARAHTPKVTLYTSTAKCILMEKVEPQADFEVEFFADGSRVHILGGESSGKLQLTQPLASEDGGSGKTSTMTLDADCPLDKLSLHVQEMVKYARQCHARCLQLEASLTKSFQPFDSKDDTDCCPFPVIIGRRASHRAMPSLSRVPPQPSSDRLPACLLALLANCSGPPPLAPPLSIPRTSPPPSHPGSPLCRAASEARQSKPPVSASTVSASQPVFVPNVGWASQPSSEELKIQFNDGACLTLQYSTATVHTIKFTAPPGDPQRQQVEQSFSPSMALPKEVRQRLESVPVVVKHLRAMQR
nr:unnamed protein product [Spirometra erinaceieuropaei]